MKKKESCSSVMKVGKDSDEMAHHKMVKKGKPAKHQKKSEKKEMKK